MDPAELVAALPKTELHLHLVGSASPETVLELATRHPGYGVPTDEARLRRFYEFVDFPHFIDTYVKVDNLVRTGDDVETLVLGAARDAARCNVRYAEITVTVAMHLQKEMTPREVATALATGRERAAGEYGVALNWIFDIPAGFGEQAIHDTVEFAVEARPPGTVALGLAGLEVGHPRAGFAAAFRTAREAGLHVVAHAGETTGPEEVRGALDALGAERIGHGIGSARDPALLARLREDGVPLEVCPTSNLRTRAVASAAEHPLPTLIAAGVPVTLSTDDPGMFGCDLDGEYALAAGWAGLGPAGLAEIARTGFRAAFCDPALRDAALADIDALVPSAR